MYKVYDGAYIKYKKRKIKNVQSEKVYDDAYTKCKKCTIKKSKKCTKCTMKRTLCVQSVRWKSVL